MGMALHDHQRNPALGRTRQDQSMKTAWAHLPNAKHIDRVLAHLEAHPGKWDAARDAAWAAARGAAWAAARDVAWGTAYTAAYTAARGAIAALIAWDNCAHLLELTPDQLRVYGRLSDDPAAVLLLPAVIVLGV